jgi:hypothetical protein
VEIWASQGLTAATAANAKSRRLRVAITIPWRSAVAAIKVSMVGSRTEAAAPRHDHAPDLGDTTIDIEDPALEPIR